MLSVAIIGAYGNFGSIIFSRLVADPGISILAVGRDQQQLLALIHETSADHWAGDAASAAFGDVLRSKQIDLVIHTAGPFQGQAYSVARSAISAGAHYCDLSDCRHFVRGIAVLDDLAKSAGVSVFSGCSSVPSLSSAVIDHYRGHFSKIDEIDFGISSSAKMPGISTVRGVLDYAGKPIAQFRNGSAHSVFGWQGLRARHLGPLGWRLLTNIDVPDMDIFPARYGAKSVRFQAGGGLKTGSLANFCVAGFVRLGVLPNAVMAADALHALGSRLEFLGDGQSAMYIDVKGVGLNGQVLTLTWQITAKNDKGPTIPSCGAIALARMLAQGITTKPGARACVGVIPMAVYLEAVGQLDISCTEKWFDGK